MNTPASGIIQKSHPKSIIRRIVQGSVREENLLLNPEPKMYKTNEDESYGYKRKPVVVLQVLLLNEAFMVKYVFEEDIEDEGE